MSLDEQIMAYLRRIKIAAKVPQIADAINQEAGAVQAALHQLDDQDMVIMHAGWYLASAKGMQE